MQPKMDGNSQIMEFIEEIDFKELTFEAVVGRGAFGVVSRAKWKGFNVAVKLIETESEKKAFITELTQLSRVSHPNIVKLYGACTKQPVCLVMEYAEGGSLYNVLHGEGPQPAYTAAHAMSWCLQCAKGVEYLHGIEPKALIHRDLKPPNLLLIAGGTVLKICDFGTACDAHTHMTNNKGSAAWMAPEVFEGSNYSEKCDVFSWGIILWEVITRRKPFDEIGGPAFRIMWAVHNGKRPPLIASCPKPLEILMTRCWSANPVERPSMSEVSRIMTHLFQFFTGADEPLQYPKEEQDGREEGTGVAYYETPPPSNLSQSSGGRTPESGMGTIKDTVRQALNLIGEAVPITNTQPRTKPVVIEDHHHPEGQVGTTHLQTSAPASLAASRESLLDKSSRSSTPIDVMKRYSADFSRLGEDPVAQGAKIAPNSQGFVKRHRRTGSHDLPVIMSGISGTSPVWSKAKEVRGHRRSGSYGNSPVVFTEQPPTSTVATSSPAKTPHRSSVTSTPDMSNKAWEPGSLVDMANMLRAGTVASNSTEMAAINMDLVAMDHQLQPLAPCPNSQESMKIFNQHLQLAHEYIRIQAETRLLTQRKYELAKEAESDQQQTRNMPRLAEEYQQLVSENEQLLMLQKNMKKQLDVIRKQQGMRRTGNT